VQRARNTNEVLTGIFLILVALLAFYLARPLSSTTEVGLGPGYVPRMLAFLQLGLGAVMVADGLLHGGEEAEAWQLRPLLLILGSVAFFALSIQRLGLIIALAGLVLIGCCANRGTRFIEAVVLAIGCAVFSVLVFVKALGMPIALWPQMAWGT